MHAFTFWLIGGENKLWHSLLLKKVEKLQEPDWEFGGAWLWLVFHLEAGNSMSIHPSIHPSMDGFG